MNEKLSLFLSLALIAPFARAAEVDKPPKDDVPTLIKQLGDDDFKTRNSAGDRLQKLGKDAVPALTQATKDADPEVAARAQSLLKQIDDDLHPKPRPAASGPGQNIRIFGGGGGAGGGGNLHVFITSSTVNVNGKSVSMTSKNGVTTKETTVTENDGRTIKIREDADGIAVTTTQKKDDKETSTTVKAKDLDTLKKDNPEAFKLYEKHAKDAGGLQINGVGGAAGQIKLEIGDGIDNKELEKQVQKQLQEAQKQVQEAQKQAEAELKKADEETKKPEQQQK